MTIDEDAKWGFAETEGDNIDNEGIDYPYLKKISQGEKRVEKWSRTDVRLMHKRYQ